MTLLRRTFLPSTADLLAFEAAARHQSVSRAAEELHLTQSAVSRQIRQLEEQIGTALFHRVRQRVVLTDAGRVYAADVQNVLQQLSASTQKAMAFSSTDGLLNLAVLPTHCTRRPWSTSRPAPSPLTLRARRLTRPSTSARRTGRAPCANT